MGRRPHCFNIRSCGPRHNLSRRLSLTPASFSPPPFLAHISFILRRFASPCRSRSCRFRFTFDSRITLEILSSRK